MISNCIGMFRIARNHPKKYLVCQKPLKADSGNVSSQRHLAAFSESFDCLQKESEWDGSCQKGLHWFIVPVPPSFCFASLNPCNWVECTECNAGTLQCSALHWRYCGSCESLPICFVYFVICICKCLFICFSKNASFDFESSFKCAVCCGTQRW